MQEQLPHYLNRIDRISFNKQFFGVGVAQTEVVHLVLSLRLGRSLGCPTLIVLVAPFGNDNLGCIAVDVNQKFFRVSIPVLQRSLGCSWKQALG